MSDTRGDMRSYYNNDGMDPDWTPPERPANASSDADRLRQAAAIIAELLLRPEANVEPARALYDSGGHAADLGKAWLRAQLKADPATMICSWVAGRLRLSE